MKKALVINCSPVKNGATAEIVKCEIYATNSFFGGVYNNGTMTIKDSKLDVQLYHPTRFDAAILNYATLTLENVNFKSTGICVATSGSDEIDVVMTINGGVFTRTSDAESCDGAIVITKWDSSKGTKLVLKGSVTVNVFEGVQKVLDFYGDATVEGLENVK